MTYIFEELFIGQPHSFSTETWQSLSWNRLELIMQEPHPLFCPSYFANCS